MHKFLSICLTGMLLASSLTAMAQNDNTVVKREMRNTWVSTVYQLDWPTSYVTKTGDADQIKKQQDEFRKMLDSLQINNFNSICFQVRARSDAMYKSSYEPWSSDLVSPRGLDPGWDPLEWAVDECHKRGMECHAWINPYRYTSSVSEALYKTEKDYYVTHPDWLLEWNNAMILNPGLPQVRQRICDVVKEIVTNYDVDGLLFDDYFYLSGMSKDLDADLYNKYKSEGGTLSQAEWRTDNVNKMVADVYNTIQSVKPWVRFGISPAGVCCTASWMGKKYDLPVCPSGYDWQYGDINSEPLAWLAQGSLDYISPQVYWTIGYNTADYGLIVPWWSNVAAKFGRHMYVSHSITTLSASSKLPGLTPREQAAAAASEVGATGPNGATFGEYLNEVMLNRNSTLNQAPGSIYFSVKYIWKNSPKFGHFLRNNVYTTQALVPAMTWKKAEDPGKVKNIKYTNGTLSWEGYDNMRYTIYAFPDNMPVNTLWVDPEFLLFTSYTTSYTLPEDKRTGYNYAVCVLDRYGNEYAPQMMDMEGVSLKAPELVYPADGAEFEMSQLRMEWSKVDNASQYVVELASDPEFATPICSINTDKTSLKAADFPSLPMNQPIHWRVRACGFSAADAVSASRTLTLSCPEITAPATGATSVSLTPTLKWTGADRTYRIQVAENSTFDEPVVDEEVNGKSYSVEKFTLMIYTTYYARLVYVDAGETYTSSTVQFRTVGITPKAPVVINPVDGGKFYADDYIKVNPVEGCYGVTFQLDNKAEVGNRFVQETSNYPSWQSRNPAGEMSKKLVVGTDYFMRARVLYRSSEGNKTSDWGPVVKATYMGERPDAVEEVEAEADSANSEYFNLQGIRVDNPAAGQVVIRRQGSEVTKQVAK